jgi:hypothetical protein
VVKENRLNANQSLRRTAACGGGFQCATMIGRRICWQNLASRREAASFNTALEPTAAGAGRLLRARFEFASGSVGSASPRRCGLALVRSQQRRHCGPVAL